MGLLVNMKIFTWDGMGYRHACMPQKKKREEKKEKPPKINNKIVIKEEERSLHGS